ncbi:MAG TPA: hypothetical protein VM737_02705 [Gemmatimonadota bacterium]|nr:hypothetical protein [Gemmatimonadota bacterium]
MAALTALASAGCRQDVQTEGSERRVVVRSDGRALPPSVTARQGLSLGPVEGAPEIVILPEGEPESATRIVYETVVEESPDSPAPAGQEADLAGAGATLPVVYPNAEAEELLLPAERTQIHLTATTTLSTDASEVGDPVTAETAEPVIVDGEVVIPEGSLVHGRVSEIERGEYPVRRPSIEIVYDRIETPDGRVIPIDARTSGEVGTVVQHPRGDHDRMRNILLGAGIGAATGGATGGKRGAVLGGVVGGTIGAGVGSGGVDWCAVLHPGDPLIIIFNRDAVIRRGPFLMNATGRD